MIIGRPVRVVAVAAAILTGGAAAYAAAPAITADGVGDVELGAPGFQAQNGPDRSAARRLRARSQHPHGEAQGTPAG